MHVGLLLLAVSACSQSKAETQPWPVRSGPNHRCSGSEDYFYVDTDGDGVGTGDAIKLPCDNGLAPLWYSWSNTDCDDTDPMKYRVFYGDADGDGVGIEAVALCGGDEIPPGYLVELSSHDDCDDSNPLVSFPYPVDADGDGIAPPNAATVCGPKDQRPPNTIFRLCSLAEPGVCDDCDDTDPNLSRLYYQDLDGDGYAASPQVSTCGNPALGPPAGFGIFSAELADCDDSRADLSPAALELWTDSVDSDCDGRLEPIPDFFTPCSLESCDPSWFAVPIDPTCDSADLVVSADPQCLCGACEFVARISNQGLVPISEYTLTVESAERTITFTVRDPLAPGGRYPYKVPFQWIADSHGTSGSVRFSVTMASPDCNPGNNTVTERTIYGPCPV